MRCMTPLVISSLGKRQQVMAPSSTVLITTDNPLAPRWQRDSSCPQETPHGYRDEFFEYAMNFTVAASSFAQDLFITFDQEADFVLRSIEPTARRNLVLIAPNNGFRFKDFAGNPLSDDLVTVDVHGPIFPELWLPAGSRFFMDFDNTQNAFAVTVAVTLRGAKRFKL
jgi:hypothetical protein